MSTTIQPGEPIILKSAAETPIHPYIESAYRYKRRPTREVMVGSVGVGGNNPIRVQSMTTTRTQDVEATLAQTMRLVEAGCEIVRITTPTSADARALGEVKRRLVEMGIDVPLVADIHFSPAAAMEAALYADKVRINPGNFADEKRFNMREYTDAQYETELARIEEKFRPVVLRCKERGIAMRIGTNHGSLSDRIMNRFGDTPEGMVEVGHRVRRHLPQVRLPRANLLDEGQQPQGDDSSLPPARGTPGRARLELPTAPGRDRSGQRRGRPHQVGHRHRLTARDGLGDTVRVSLTEEPEEEIPVAFELVKPYNEAISSTTDDGRQTTGMSCCPTCATLITTCRGPHMKSPQAR